MTVNKSAFNIRIFLINEIIKHGKIVATVAKENNINCGTLSGWLRKYRTSGPEVLQPYRKRCHYTYQEKVAAVLIYYF